MLTRCSGECGGSYPKEGFPKDSGYKCGHKPRCKTCHYKYVAKKSAQRKARKLADPNFVVPETHCCIGAECEGKGEQPSSNFYPDLRHGTGLDYYCKLCRKKARDIQRLEVMQVYCNGTPRCQCCGETEFGFLTIDHIDGGGRKHREELKGLGHPLITWLRNNNYPPGFQILCWNCNASKFYSGCCPHQRNKQQETGTNLAPTKSKGARQCTSHGTLNSTGLKRMLMQGFRIWFWAFGNRELRPATRAKTVSQKDLPG